MTRVLLAEDDSAISEPLARALRREGYEVEVVEDGARALESARQAPDLVVLDLGLPKLDGWHPVMLTGLRGGSGDELARALRDVDAPAPTDVASACQAARTAARPGDRIVVLGSFQTVAPVLAAQPWLSDSPPPQSREA